MARFPKTSPLKLMTLRILIVICLILPQVNGGFSAFNSTFATASFGPLSLSPTLWLDASDASTLYDSTSGGGMVTTNGAVARWQDKSGNSNHATQATLGRRPLRAAGIQNGRDVMRFDGADDFFTYSISQFGYAAAASVFAVTKNLVHSSGDYGAIIGEFGGVGNSISCATSTYPSASGMDIGTDAFGPTGVKYGPGAVQGNPHISDWSWSNWSTHKTNGDTKLAVDGVESLGTVYGSGSITGFSPTLKMIGCFDSNPSSSSCIQGDVLEILVFPRQLTQVERIKVRQYLSAK